MNPTNILRAIMLAAVFGLAVIFLGGILARLGSKAGSAARAAV
jgi:hypothetical protein